VLEDLKGKTLQEATAALAVLGLLVDPAIQTENDPTVPSGQVIRADPAVGATVKQGDTIKIIISAGANQVSMPPVEGLSQANAQSLLSGDTYGLRVSIQQEASDSVLAGNATRTDPASGTLVTKGAPVVLYISTGATQIKVPPLVTLTEAQARAKLTQLGLVPNVSTQSVPFADPTDGRVIAQTPSSPTLVAPGSTVNLTVGKALPPTPVTVSITGSFTYNGSAQAATVTTSPAGVSNTVTYNGSATPPTNAGTYTVVVTITDPKYVLSGSGSGSITIKPATVTLSFVTSYSGASPPSNIVTTSPGNVSFTASYVGTGGTVYGPTPNAPTIAGTYTVTVTITDPNYVLPGSGTSPTITVT
jgi:beta-lactam-binding protein with PASTA domain